MHMSQHVQFVDEQNLSGKSVKLHLENVTSEFLIAVSNQSQLEVVDIPPQDNES